MEITQLVKERETELIKTKAKFRDTKDEVLEAAIAEVKSVSKYSALISALGNKSMQEKHWVKVWGLVEGQPSTLLNFTFYQLLQ